MEKKRVLVGSPVHQKPAILKEFLNSLRNLKQENIIIDFMFIDDNTIDESSKLLYDFRENNNQVFINTGKKTDKYERDEVTHHWNESLIWKVAGFKDTIIEKAIELNYDYLFLIDSDILIYPQTIEHLISTEKDIISEIHWTPWQEGAGGLPNVWFSDEYNLVPKQRGEQITREEEVNRFYNYMERLRMPGVYEVGGLCACTLISKKALKAGVNFKLIKNLSYWGEDRHFCIRASALGLSLFVDTYYPGYHIYRESDLTGVEEFKKLVSLKA